MEERVAVDIDGAQFTTALKLRLSRMARAWFDADRGFVDTVLVYATGCSIPSPSSSSCPVFLIIK
jgi:hypothetical protein